jgi:hypothetical protein
MVACLFEQGDCGIMRENVRLVRESNSRIGTQFTGVRCSAQASHLEADHLNASRASPSPRPVRKYRIMLGQILAMQPVVSQMPEQGHHGPLRQNMQFV